MSEDANSGSEAQRGQQIRQPDSRRPETLHPEGPGVLTPERPGVRSPEGLAAGGPRPSQLRAENEALRRRVLELERLGDRSRVLESLYRDAPIGFCLVDSDLRFVWINDLMASIHGQPVDAHLGRRVDELLPALAAQVVPVYERVFASGVPAMNVEVRGSLPSDPFSEHVWLAHHHPQLDADAKLVGVVTVMQDITLVRRTQDAHEAARDHLEQAQRLSGIGSWEWCLTDDRMWWSDELYRMLSHRGGPSHPVSYEALLEHVHAEDRAKLSEQLDRAFASDSTCSAELRVLRGDGRVRRVRSRCELLRNADGSPLRLIGTLQELGAGRRRGVRRPVPKRREPPRRP